MQTTTLYDQDFFAWTQRQVELLKTQQWEQVDVENLIEEIDSLGKQERRELCNRLGILLGHLLKWHYQPEARSKSWFYTIKEQRIRIVRHLKDNPSLKPYLDDAIAIGILSNFPHPVLSLKLKSLRSLWNWSYDLLPNNFGSINSLHIHDRNRDSLPLTLIPVQLSTLQLLQTFLTDT